MSSAVREFETLYRKYDGLVRTTLRRYGVRPADLDDVAQEAFVTIHRKLPEFEGRSSLETWLHAVCWRTAVGYRRRAHIRREAVLNVDGQTGPEPVVEGLAADRLHALLSGLPEQERDLLALSEAGGLSISALAELSECTRETASERLRRARLALRHGLDESSVASGDARDAGGANAVDQAYDTEGALETADSFDYIDDDCCICVLGAKTFVIWRKSPHARQLGILKEAMRKSMEREGNKLTYLAIVEVGSATVPIDRATRKVNAEIFRMLGGSVRGAAVAVESNGMANVVPAVVNTAMFLARSTIPMRYFTNVSSAAAWLAPCCQSDTSASLTAQLEWMRARLDARTR